MKKAIYAGTFGPFHAGHKMVIEKASKLFDFLFVVVANNPEKEKTSDLDKRFDALKNSISLSNVEVLKMEEGLLVDFAKELGVNYLVRSARDSKDFDFELMMAIQNKKMNNDIETVLVMPDESKLMFRSTLLPKK